MTFRQIKKLILGVGIGTLSIASTIAPVTAQQFNISPMVTITEARNGQAKGTINVTNLGKEPLRMRVYAEDFTYDRQKGFMSIGSHDRSAIPYLQFSPRELLIPPGVTRNVRIGTIIPPSLPDREYRAVLFVEDLKERNIKPNGGNAVVIKARVGSVFYVSKGATSPDLQVSGAIWDNTAKQLKIVLSNKGKQSDYPDINWRIEKDGKEVAKDSLRGALIQSESEREFSLKANGKNVVLPSASYTLSGEIITSKKNQRNPFSIKFTIP